VRLCIAGAAPDTGNLGVSALCIATVEALRRRAPDAEIFVLDHGRGERPDPLLTAAACGRGGGVYRVGAYSTRRVWRPESLARVSLGARMGIGAGAARAIRTADAVLDISGGDSFAELYGPARLRAVMRIKKIALACGRPLVLLPQTYGPFGKVAAREGAAEVLSRASLAFARDEASLGVVRRVLGKRFDPARHCGAADVAFTLRAERPPFCDSVAWWTGQGLARVAVNVSGLLLNRPAAAARFGMSCDYGALMRGLVGRLSERGAAVLLVPHVVTRAGHEEDDATACRSVIRGLPAALRSRVRVMSPLADPRQVKWVIGRGEWFCGMRMHSGIAALSSGVPAAAVAYSGKTAGVFAGCGLGGAVVDGRGSTTAEALERLWREWQMRSARRAVLRATLPRVVDRAEGAFDLTFEAVLGVSARRQALREAA
jgi:colanic acid/amylovoran biosynthesis protein